MEKEYPIPLEITKKYIDLLGQERIMELVTEIYTIAYEKGQQDQYDEMLGD